MYRVIVAFHDLKNGGKFYNVGDKFPKDGIVPEARLAELSTNKNRRGVPLIEFVADKAEDKVEDKPKRTKKK